MPVVGDKLRCVVPIIGDLNPQPTAIEALERCAREHGLTATDIQLVSAKPWDEEIDGLGPYEEFTIHTYEATAGRAG